MLLHSFLLVEGGHGPCQPPPVPPLSSAIILLNFYPTREPNELAQAVNEPSSDINFGRFVKELNRAGR